MAAMTVLPKRLPLWPPLKLSREAAPKRRWQSRARGYDEDDNDWLRQLQPRLLDQGDDFFNGAGSGSEVMKSRRKQQAWEPLSRALSIPWSCENCTQHAIRSTVCCV